MVNRERDGRIIQLLIIFQKNNIINMIVFVEKSGIFIASYPMQCCIG